MFSQVLVFALIASAVQATQHVTVEQDTLGRYNLGYAIDGISRAETRDIFGNVNGGFSYIDPHGLLRETKFTSGVHGFHAFGPDIPKPVLDTPEVAIAKAQHLATLNAAYIEAANRPHFVEGFPHGPVLHPVPEIPLIRNLGTLGGLPLDLSLGRGHLGNFGTHLLGHGLHHRIGEHAIPVSEGFIKTEVGL